jgi:hypothetical protein
MQIAACRQGLFKNLRHDEHAVMSNTVHVSRRWVLDRPHKRTWSGGNDGYGRNSIRHYRATVLSLLPRYRHSK